TKATGGLHNNFGCYNFAYRRGPCPWLLRTEGAKRRQKKMRSKVPKIRHGATPSGASGSTFLGVPEGTSLPTTEEIPMVAMTLKDWEVVASESKETKARKMVGLELEINDSLPDSEEEDAVHIALVMSSLFDDEDDEDNTAKAFTTKDGTPPAANVPGPISPMVEPATLVVTPSVTIEAEENVELENAKKAIEDDAPLGEGPFDQELGGRKYRVHQAAGNTMGAKQLAKAMGFAEQFGYPSGATIFGGGPDDYLYCCPDNLETDVCHYMADNIGFPKLEAGLPLMPFDNFSDCLAYTHLKGLFLSKALKNRKNIEGEATQSEILKLRSEVSRLRNECNEKEESFKVLKSDFLESRTEVRTLIEEKDKLKEALDTKSLEFEASTSKKDKRIASLEAELKEAGDKFEAKSGKLKLAIAEAAMASQMKIGDLKDEISHLMQLKENYKILTSNCYTLGSRCKGSWRGPSLRRVRCVGKSVPKLRKVTEKAASIRKSLQQKKAE
ncbi:hypothetical protein ACJX0J_041496, partial [Zea mays]